MKRTPWPLILLAISAGVRLLLSPLPTQALDGWSIPLTVSVGETHSTVYMGVDPDATDQYDLDIDLLAPPPPPGGAYVYFYDSAGIPGLTDKLSRDYRSTSVATHEWTLSVAFTSGASGSLAWNLTDFPGGILTLDGADMLATNSLPFTGDQNFTIYYEALDFVEIALPDTTAFYQEQLTVPVRLTDTTGQDIVSAELFVAYDSDLLTAFSVGTSGTMLTPGWSTETNYVEGAGTTIDTVKIAMATGDEALSGAGTLLEITFQIADLRHPATSPLTLTHALFNDGAPNAIPIHGSMTLVGTDGAIDSAPASIIPRETIQLTVDDIDENRDPGNQETLAVTITSGGQTETIPVTETNVATGLFTGSIATVFSLSPSSGDGILQAIAGDTVSCCYADSLDAFGITLIRCDTTTVHGGHDSRIRVSAVSQPGDTVRVRVTDPDLNTDPATAQTTTVTGIHGRTGESETILLTEYTADDSIFFGRVETAFGTSPGSDDDGLFLTEKADTLYVTYADEVTALGGTADRPDTHCVVDPFGDADANGQVQAFDAARVLYHRLFPFLTGLDSLAANLDQQAPFSEITPFDASLILQKRVGLVERFPVQEPDAANHPQPETSSTPRLIPDERRVTLQKRDGYLSLWTEERARIVSGELLVEGIQEAVSVSGDLEEFLSASRLVDGGLRIVFAGARPVSGPGELLRLHPQTEGDGIRIMRVEFNDGRIVGYGNRPLSSGSVPAAFALYPNHPNPFNAGTAIRFDLSRDSRVRLEVFDVVGQRVRMLVAKSLPGGAHQAEWDGRSESGESAGSGVYFYRLQAQYAGEEFSQVRRMLLLK